MVELIRFFKFFYKLKGMTVIYLLLLMIAAALFETMGVSIFLPILDGGNLDNPVGRVISYVFALMKIEYSFSKLLVFMVFLFFLRGTFSILQISYVGRITADLLVSLRTKTVFQLFKTNYLYFLSKNSGYINNAVTVEFERLAFALRMYANVLLAIIFSIMYLSIPLVIEPVASTFILFIGIPAIYFIRKINLKTKRYSTMTSNHSAHLQSILIQALRHFMYLKSTYSQNNILRKIDHESKKLGELRFKQAILQAITAEGFMPFIVLIIAALLFYQVEVAGEGTAQTIFIVFLLFRAISQILASQQCYRKFLMSIGSIRVHRTLEREIEENREDLGCSTIVPDFEKHIEFKNVTFRYPNGVNVLENINITILPKATVAFFGPSGAGKSTLVSLLTGILKPSEGEILIAGKPYSEIDQKELRRGIGYVTQESVIFNDTIKNNITLWRENVSTDQFRTAVACAHLKDFIKQLPQGYETLLGNDGTGISGGQRQRIGIARELFKDIKLLIFDEATSALDYESEATIQKNIDDLKGKCTIIIIAHRISTIKNCKMIYVLDKGRIVEEGTFDQLYHDRRSVFYKMSEL